MIASAAMGYAGQKCTATSRVICEQPVHVAMRDALVDASGGMVVERPADPACQVGPLITAGAREDARWPPWRARSGRGWPPASPADPPGRPAAPTCSRP